MTNSKKSASPKRNGHLSNTAKSEISSPTPAGSEHKQVKGKPESWVNKIDWFGENAG